MILVDTPSDSSTYPLPNGKIITQSYFYTAGDATGGQVYFSIRLHLLPFATSSKFRYKINYINFITNDLNFTNALGNRMDYPYLDINGNNWTEHPTPIGDRIPLYLEEGYNQLSITAQWRIQDIELGHPKNLYPYQYPAVAIYYFNTNGCFYAVQIEYETVRTSDNPIVKV